MSFRENIHEFFLNNKEEINSFGVSRLGLFGSVVREEEDSASDIDLLVEFTEGQKNYDNYIDLCFFLEDKLGKRIDLLTAEGVSPLILKKISKEVEYVQIAP